MLEIKQFSADQMIRLPLDRRPELRPRLEKYLRDQVRSTREGLKELFEDKVPLWRRSYEARPAQETRDFPFENASNLIVPIIGIHSDTLLARVMSAVLKTRPPWVAQILGGSNMKDAENIKAAIEQYLEYVGLEPTELDLFRVYQEFFGETIRYGTSILKCPIERVFEDMVYPSGDGTGSYEVNRTVTYEGPRPEKLAFQDFLISPMAKTVERAEFKAHRVRLSRLDLEQRRYMKLYDADAVADILAVPDRTSPETIDQEKQDDAGTHQISGYGWAEWDIYECHFKFRLEADKFVRGIAFYHERTNTIARAYFNYYPLDIFIAARLFYRDDMFHGYGFAEMLDNHQEELSVIHNQRRDNMTVANTRVWRANPDSKLHGGYKIYPSALLPAEKDELEAIAHGELSPVSIQEEQLSMELAERRSGVTPPQQGMGAGAAGKRGVYSAMGTLSMLQEGNSRTDLNISDMRYAHGKLGRVILTLRAMLGLGRTADQFQETGKHLETAIDLIRQGKLTIPLQSSSASINREVEKQNDLMLMKVAQGHFTGIGQMLLSSLDPRLPENVKSYTAEAVVAANNLFRIVLRHFGYEEVERLAPEPKAPPTPPPGGQGGGPPSGPGSPGGASPGAPGNGGPMTPFIPPPAGGRPM
jgi:hypothetical protein